MKQKHYLLFYGWAYALIAVFLIVIAIIIETDTVGLILGGILVSALSYKSYSSFKKLRTTNDEDKAFAPPANATAYQQLSYYKRLILVLWIAIPILSVITINDMNDFVSGDYEYVGVWEPVLFAYSIGGYWLAVSTVPLIGVVITLLFIKKLSNIKKQANTQAFTKS